MGGGGGGAGELVLMFTTSMGRGGTGAGGGTWISSVVLQKGRQHNVYEEMMQHLHVHVFLTGMTSLTATLALFAVALLLGLVQELRSLDRRTELARVLPGVEAAGMATEAAPLRERMGREVRRAHSLRSRSSRPIRERRMGASRAI